MKNILCKSVLTAIFCIIIYPTFAQVIERTRPTEWEQLVPGARFIDRFLPMKGSKLAPDNWGTEGVKLRFIDNGIENRIWSFWGGNIVKADDGKYHLIVCGWLENSPAGHMEWPKSYVFNTVSDTPYGPFEMRNLIGRGHNPEVYRLPDGRYVLYVIDGCYVANELNGTWTPSKLTFDARDRCIIEGLSNLSFTRREDGSFVMVCRGGGIWISRDGFHFQQVSNGSVYPKVDGRFEDPVIWKDYVQYNLIVNDWYGRIAYYLRSDNGIEWEVDPGEAYMPGIAYHADGMKEDWFKYERIKVYQDDYGRAVQANFAVIDTLKFEDKASDQHSSKNITIPLNPGLLVTLLNKKPITHRTREICIKIAAETGFNPQTDLNITSLRLGASSEVNFGRGCLVKHSEKQGNDLIVTFDAVGHGLTSTDFTVKLIGKNNQGNMIYGYARLPYRNYKSPVLSACAPQLQTDGSCLLRVDNFGLSASAKTQVKIEIVDIQGYRKLLGTVFVGALQPYESTEVKIKPYQWFPLSSLKQAKVVVSFLQQGHIVGQPFSTTIRTDKLVKTAM